MKVIIKSSNIFSTEPLNKFKFKFRFKFKFKFKFKFTMRRHTSVQTHTHTYNTSGMVEWMYDCMFQVFNHFKTIIFPNKGSSDPTSIL